MLPLARYRFVYRAKDSLRLPVYAGSTWRGAFGHALKKLVCVTRERQCQPCLLYRNCLYPQLFATPADPNISFLAKVDKAPPPFVLLPELNKPRTYASGATLRLYCTLIGNANQQLPYIIHALDRVGQSGLTERHAKLTLTEVQQAADDAWPVIYRPGETLQSQPAKIPVAPPCPATLRLSFLTPFRSKRAGHLITPLSFDAAALLTALLRRLSLLSAYHSDEPVDVDTRNLVQQANRVTLINKQLFWREYERYSSRQQTTMKMGGVVGTVKLDGAELVPFWPYLWLGQYTHVGKWTDMGLGYYHIEMENHA